MFDLVIRWMTMIFFLIRTLIITTQEQEFHSKFDSFVLHFSSIQIQIDSPIDNFYLRNANYCRPTISVTKKKKKKWGLRQCLRIRQIKNDTMHTNFNFDPFVNFDLEYLTNAATSGPDKFFHNYLHTSYAESPFIRVYSRSNCIYPLLYTEL